MVLERDQDNRNYLQKMVIEKQQIIDNYKEIEVKNKGKSRRQMGHNPKADEDTLNILD